MRLSFAELRLRELGFTPLRMRSLSPELESARLSGTSERPYPRALHTWHPTLPRRAGTGHNFTTRPSRFETACPQFMLSLHLRRTRLVSVAPALWQRLARHEHSATSDDAFPFKVQEQYISEEITPHNRLLLGSPSASTSHSSASSVAEALSSARASRDIVRADYEV